MRTDAVVPMPGQAAALADTPAEAPSPSPARLAWRRLKRNRAAMLGLFTLAFLYVCAAFGSFLAPYDPSEPNLDRSGHPPTRPRFVDQAGKFHLRPFVYGMTCVDYEKQTYAIDPARVSPIVLFPKCEPYRLWWFIPLDRKLIGAQSDGYLGLLGADSKGRDNLSRLLEGAKVSLSIGLIGITVSMGLGLLFGGLAGYFGGWADAVTMRMVEFLLAVPSLYFIIAARSYFQVKAGPGGAGLTSVQLYALVILLLSLIGWAGPARVIRGMVLSTRELEYVLAERALGAGTMRILWLHILPNTLSYVIVASTIMVPGYILAEVGLSFLNVGIEDPNVSWGNMLNDAQSVPVIQGQPWLLAAPGGAIFATVMAFNFLGDGLRDALDPKHGGR